MNNETDAVFSIVKNHRILARELCNDLYVSEFLRIEKKLRLLVFGGSMRQVETLARSIAVQINELAENAVCSLDSVKDGGLPCFRLEIVFE